MTPYVFFCYRTAYPVLCSYAWYIIVLVGAGIIFWRLTELSKKTD